MGRILGRNEVSDAEPSLIASARDTAFSISIFFWENATFERTTSSFELVSGTYFVGYLLSNLYYFQHLPL